MQQRRPPLGAMLFGLTALLAGWSMAALAGSDAGREGSRGGPPPRDVPMVVVPPGASDPQGVPPSPPATQGRQKAEAPPRATGATVPGGELRVAGGWEPPPRPPAGG
jgi:hypothetical protein